MKIQQARKAYSRIKLGIQGPSGSGKTYSSLLLAKGLVGDWSKILVIDTENGSSNLYAHLGEYNVLPLQAPFTPEKYIEAIGIGEEQNMQCIIIDSISHCWEELLQFHSSLPGNSFTNWSKVTPRHSAFVNAILASNAHIITTMRTKQDYVLNLKNGKYIPEKVGLKAIQRDGIDYELSIVFDINIQHQCKVSKDRTGLFHPDNSYHNFQISEKTGETIAAWLSEENELEQQITSCRDIAQLQALYNQYKPCSPEVNQLFKLQKQILQSKMMSTNGNEK